MGKSAAYKKILYADQWIGVLVGVISEMRFLADFFS